MAGDFAAIPEQDDSRDTADAKSAGALRIGVRIELCEPDMGFKSPGGALEVRCHHLAWSAPFGPEIHHYGNAAALDVGRKAGIGERDRSGGEQRTLAFSAIGIISQPAPGDPVDGVTVRAGDVMIVVHVLQA